LGSTGECLADVSDDSGTGIPVDHAGQDRETLLLQFQGVLWRRLLFHGASPSGMTANHRRGSDYRYDYLRSITLRSLGRAGG
jgi:hypothetical protein